MAHSIHFDNYTIHCDGDYKGVVAIIHEPSCTSMTVPASLLFDFVAEAVRQAKISELEQATPLQLLGLK